jgi:hypothetical protein
MQWFWCCGQCRRSFLPHPSLPSNQAAIDLLLLLLLPVRRLVRRLLLPVVGCLLLLQQVVVVQVHRRHQPLVLHRSHISSWPAC